MRRTGGTLFGSKGGTPLGLMKWGGWTGVTTVMEYLDRCDAQQRTECSVFDFAEHVCEKIFDKFWLVFGLLL